jgi:hypothetical protein
LGTLIAQPPIEVLVPALPPLIGSGGSGLLALGTVLAQPPLQVIAPAAVRPLTGRVPFATTVAQPPLQVVAPAAVNVSGSNLGTTVGQPPIRVVAPAAPPLTAPGTTLALPPVTVHIGTPQLLRTAK